MANQEKLVWIDCEMTGLDLQIDEIVEVAVVITDYDLQPIDEGFQIVIKPSAKALAQMGEFVTQMHTDSGLINDLSTGEDIATAEAQILDYIKSHIPEEKTAVLAGNSIGTDRSFIAKYLPAVNEHLHYRNLDVSSVKILARQWFPRIYFNAPEKNGGHRALADILESIKELDYYRSAFFVSEPGPTSNELKKIQEQINNKHKS